ncbi:MAG TPA: FkbM family methyltransferase [Pyrinomonadaceae bacterium]|nr:FkbM family methyltransferase [Pyrinomonadaceae bacterium]
MSSSRSAFMIALMNQLTSSMTNCYGADNWDSERFGPYKSTLKSSLISKLNGLLAGSLAIVPLTNAPDLDWEKLDRAVEGLSALYELLEDEQSKSTLVQLITYRLLGARKVKLSLNNVSYWSQRQQVRKLVKSREGIQVSMPKAVLNHLALEEIGYPIELYYTAGGVVSTFMLKQYQYGKSIPPIKVQDSDYVIDAGGGWGDTALYFAHEAGAQGRVFTFEFTPENLEIFARNVSMNPLLATRIELDKRALWNVSGEVFDYFSHGPGTSLDNTRHHNNGGASLQVTTVSIDDLVKEKNLPKLDFIKMDVEGAELNVLKGAEQSIRTFMPRLAISVYHKENDLTEIPEYLNALGLGYKFFLDHFTIHNEETVLFARAESTDYTDKSA